MRKRNNRIMSVIMAVALTIPTLGNISIPVYAQEAEEKRQYIIVADTDEAYEETAEDVAGCITVDTPVLSDNNVIVAELTEKEAETIENSNVLVEEDIVLTASTAGMEEPGKELTLEEAKQRKAEINRKKKEELESQPTETEKPAIVSNAL